MWYAEPPVRLWGGKDLLGRGLKNADIAYIGIYMQYQGGIYTPLTPPKPDRVSCVPHPCSAGGID